MNLEGLLDGGVDVVLARRLREVLLDRKGPSRDAEHGGVASEEVGELLRVQRRRRHDELQVPPLLRDDLTEQPQKHVRVQRPLVGLVHDDGRVRVEVRLAEGFTEKDAVGHVLDLRLVRGAILEANRVAHVFPDVAADFLRHSPRDRHGRHSPRLRAPDHPQGRQPVFVEELRHLRRLPGARLPDDHHDLVVAEHRQQFLSDPVHGQRPTLLGERRNNGFFFHHGHLLLLGGLLLRRSGVAARGAVVEFLVGLFGEFRTLLFLFLPRGRRRLLLLWRLLLGVVVDADGLAHARAAELPEAVSHLGAVPRFAQSPKEGRALAGVLGHIGRRILDGRDGVLVLVELEARLVQEGRPQLVHEEVDPLIRIVVVVQVVVDAAFRRDAGRQEAVLFPGALVGVELRLPERRRIFFC
mmetsp:Transcript_4303/g.14281  ORF Transcript_4303/g.14281 Transcript_4303/m.14281 type:complete len:411 (+) Transcript_4303:1720-2952(+)